MNVGDAQAKPPQHATLTRLLPKPTLGPLDQAKNTRERVGNAIKRANITNYKHIMQSP
jgi:hypothetical protein